MLMSVIDRVWRFIDVVLPGVLIGLVTGMIAADIVLRNVFRSTIPDGIEIATYAFVWMIFLASAGAAREGAHFQVDLIGVMKSSRGRIAGRVLIEAVCGTIAGLLTHISWGYTMRSWTRVSEGLEIPLGYFYMIFPFCFALMSLSHLRRAIAYLTGARPA